ncbi:MAG: glycosyltransferase [Pararhodobacter sp.]|nr:glycosyltransferase [Pararhodobacter sp.]
MSAQVHCIILNWRTAEMTLKAVAAAQRAMEGIEGAITVIDNDSQDGSFERLCAALGEGGAGDSQGGRVRVLQSGHNGGFGAGNNFGIRAGLPDGARPDYVHILNSDAFPAPDAIAALLRHMQANPAAGFAGSHIHGPEGEPHVTAFRFPSMMSEFEGAAHTGPVTRLLSRHVVPLPVPAQTGPVDWLAGASVMMRQDMLDAIGLFDERFFLYFEETDLMLRGARKGWKTHYVVESRVMHIGSASTGMKEWRRVPGYWFDSRWHYFAKNHGRVYAGLATLAQLAGLGLHGLRVALGSGNSRNPPYFFRDLVKHSLAMRIGPEQ